MMPAVRGDEPSGMDFFESKIRPVLVEKCYSCHSTQANEANGDLLLDSQPALRRGGSRGSVLAAHADESLLWKAIQYADADLQMPPDGRLPQNVIDDFRQWINMGAPDPRKQPTAPIAEKQSIPELTKTHWAYQPPQSQAAPDVQDKDWARTVIDRWILAKLESRGLHPNSMADRRALIRRLYYDLTGLTPTFEQIESFVNDSSESAYENLVDQLLAQSSFGERMARRWMDVTRYSDTKGYVFQEDRSYPHAYRYRDWLIRSFNQDLPYDQFIRYQIAADRLDPDNAQGNLDAMGALTLGRRFLNNPNDIADDRIDVVTRGFMGVTVGCARCHDHKFDPVSMADYYSLHGVFVNSDEPGGDPSPMRLVDRPEQRETFIFLRGQQGNRGPKIERMFVAFLDRGKPKPLNEGSGRLNLANAIVDPENPLTARVYVNRIWGWIVGTPLVDTPSDFGLRCEPPVQHEVLDLLAHEFVADQFSTKRLIKRIVMSAVYRQSSDSNPAAMQIDPENRLLWRAQRKRMDFESYRDAMLQVSGKLDVATVGGPSQPIHEAPYSMRRTVYAYIDRQNLPNIFRTFDVANPDAHAPQRAITTVPQQGLFVLNGEPVYEAAAALVKSVLGEKPSATTDETALRERIEALTMRALARRPSEKEFALFRDFVLNAGSTRAPIWQYGYGAFEAEQLVSFQTFPTLHEKRWMGSQTLPDPTLGWLFLSAESGHPGANASMSVVRRWTAPSSGSVRLRGKLIHKPDQGDGVRATVLHNQKANQGQWTVKQTEQTTLADMIAVEQGDTIDLVVDPIKDNSHDSFEWTVQIKYTSGDASEYRSRRDFQANDLEQSDAWTQLAQALLATNEFCFID